MIEYKIAAVLWLVACAAWFYVGYTLGRKTEKKRQEGLSEKEENTNDGGEGKE